MTKAPAFQALQQTFVQHLRDPDNRAAPGQHEDRRMAIYRNAIYENVAALMADNYPRIRSLMDDGQWQAVIRDYIITHASRTSVFVDLPLEFLSYIKRRRETFDDPPYWYELAHFDWVETLVGADLTTIDMNSVDATGDLLRRSPRINPTLRMLRYQFPVHALNPDYQPDQAPVEITQIAAFRDFDDRYGFLDLNAASAALLRSVALNSTASGQQLLEALAQQMGVSGTPAFMQGGLDILERMRSRAAILGVRTE